MLREVLQPARTANWIRPDYGNQYAKPNGLTIVPISRIAPRGNP